MGFSPVNAKYTKMTQWKNFIKGVISENPVFVMLLGMCPTLGVTSTAINGLGMGLATAINRMKESPSRSKIVILLTDGENTTGYITPDQATEIAVSLGIRVYTVGIGSEGVVMSPSQRGPNGSYIFGPRMLKFNTDLLKDIADRTKGKFYRAYSERDLKGIYAEIDRLEKTKVEIKTVQRTKEYYEWFVGIAIALLLLEFLGRWTVLRSVTP